MKFNDKVLEVIGSESLENFHNVIENINEIIETKKFLNVSYRIEQ